MHSSLPVKGITILLGNDLAGGRVIESPKVSEMPQMVTNEGTIKHFAELFLACAITRGMLQAESSNTPLEQNEAQDATQSSTLEEQLDLADTFLGNLPDDSPTFSSISAMPRVNELNVNSVLS